MSAPESIDSIMGVELFQSLIDTTIVEAASSIGAREMFRTLECFYEPTGERAEYRTNFHDTELIDAIYKTRVGPFFDLLDELIVADQRGDTESAELCATQLIATPVNCALCAFYLVDADRLPRQPLSYGEIIFNQMEYAK